jgi:hypothetical protein
MMAVPGRRERRLRPDEGEGERREQRGEDWTVHENSSLVDAATLGASPSRRPYVFANSGRAI